MYAIYIKRFSVLVVAIIFMGCSNLKEKIEWKNPNLPLKMKDNKLYLGDNILDIQEGDILIKEKQNTFLGLLGHSAIVIKNYLIVDYPKIGYSAEIIPINLWLEENRKFLILRYKNIDDEFRRKLFENIKKNLDKKYRISFDKKSNNSFYCSKFIWYIYYTTGKDFGVEIDLDGNGGYFILPYDFLESSKLEIVN